MRRPISFLLALPLLVACSGSSSSSGGDPASGGAGGEPPAATTPPSKDAGDGADASPARDASAADAGPTMKAVTLQIDDASYRNTTAAGGGFVYAVTFSLVNTSSSSVVSLASMTFDFGGGDQVSLTKPACSGAFAIAPGESRTVDTQVVVSDAGSVTNFAIICGSSQHFGGASGKAPGVSTFADPIAIAVSGTTSDGTFAGAGTATRSN